MKVLSVLLLLFAALVCRPAFCGEFHEAVDAGDLEKVKSLLKMNPRLVNEARHVKRMSGPLDIKWTPLCLAAFGNNNEMTQLLLKNGADPNIKMENGKAPLHFAATYRHHAVVETLAANGADVNLADGSGNPPLFVTDVHYVAEILLRYKADPDLRNAKGLTRLATLEIERKGVLEQLEQMEKKHGTNDEQVVLRRGELARIGRFMEVLRRYDAKE